jgi:hypothetical protein
MKKVKMAVTLTLTTLCAFAQKSVKLDSLQESEIDKFKYESLILPSALLSYGIIGLESHKLQQFNISTREEVKEHIDTKLIIDNFSQYAPFLTVYGLNAAGIRGKNNLKNRTIILAGAYLTMGLTVNILKNTTRVLRPDGSSTNSFPSGHTATAFMGAEFLYQEYKDISVWYGISGYLVAAGTGLFRVYNNRHWLTDIAAGAGIGILSTKIAYWTYPMINKRKTKSKRYDSAFVMPYYGNQEIGIRSAMVF